MLNSLISNSSLEARGVIAFYPANSTADDIVVYESEGDIEPRWTLHGIRNGTKPISVLQRQVL
jgi:cobalamin-dependent methionine synthase I